MLTSRGWWLLFTVLILVVFAALVPPRGQTTLVLVGLTLLVWFCWEWLKFAFFARLVARNLFVEREVRDDHGPVETLWAGRAFEVRVALRLRGAVRLLPYVIVRERVPFGVEFQGGEVLRDGAVTADEPLTLTYRLRCRSAGQVRFEGVAVELADLQGFFHQAVFVHGVVLYRVMPPLADAEGHTAAVKRHNLLPPPGVHRHRRPGTGSELLDLRDYLPGDPPRTIAWKASARRDRLITKEFESEVPVRCTLFVDTSNSVRLGPPGQNALARLVEIAAVVAQANSAGRDLTGLCLFDEQGTTYIRPARGPRHLAELLNRLTEAAGLAPTTGNVRVDQLQSLAYAFAQETYPELLRPDINSFPFWLPWLSPQPAWTKDRPTLRDRLYASPPWVFGLYGLGYLAVLALVALYIDHVFLGLLIIIGYLFGGAVLAWMWFVLLGLSFGQRRRRAGYRKRLAALLSVRYDLGPGGLGLLLEDDERFTLLVQRFLAEHQVPYSLPLYDSHGRYLFAAPGKVEVLAGALMRAVGKGHDNELFVLLGDVLELEDRLGPLLRAVKVAIARHHRVLLICPWPPGIPLPRQTSEGDELAARTGLDGSLRRATTMRFHRAFQQVRRAFARLGVPVLPAASGDPARLILERVDWLRMPGRVR